MAPSKETLQEKKAADMAQQPGSQSSGFARPSPEQLQKRKEQRHAVFEKWKADRSATQSEPQPNPSAGPSVSGSDKTPSAQVSAPHQPVPLRFSSATQVLHWLGSLSSDESRPLSPVDSILCDSSESSRSSGPRAPKSSESHRFMSQPGAPPSQLAQASAQSPPTPALACGDPDSVSDNESCQAVAWTPG